MKKRILIMIITTLAAWSGPVAAFEAGGVNVHGFISQGFLCSDEYNYLSYNSTDGSFEYNEVGINFSKQLTDKLRVGLQLFSRDLGDVANNKITLDWAFADYRLKDWIGLRFGKIKLPIGLYNEIRDVDMLRTNIVLPQGIYNDMLRDNLIALNGVGLYGNIDMQSAGSLDYQLLAGAINSDSESGSGKYTRNSLSAVGGDYTANATNDTSYAGAVRWETPLEGLRIGYSLFEGGDTHIPITLLGGLVETTIEGSTRVQVVSVEYTWNNLVVTAEYMDRRNKGTILGNESILDAECYYLSASYRFSDLFTLGAIYSIYYPDKDDRDGDNLAIDHKAWEKDLALTLRFDINEYWIFKIEGHAVDGTANVLGIDNEDNDFSDSSWYYGAAKATFNF